MNLVERLDRAKQQLDLKIQDRLVQKRYDLAMADLRQLLEEAKNRIVELEKSAS